MSVPCASVFVRERQMCLASMYVYWVILGLPLTLSTQIHLYTYTSTQHMRYFAILKGNSMNRFGCNIAGATASPTASPRTSGEREKNSSSHFRFPTTRSNFHYNSLHFLRGTEFCRETDTHKVSPSQNMNLNVCVRERERERERETITIPNMNQMNGES